MRPVSGLAGFHPAMENFADPAVSNNAEPGEVLLKNTSLANAVWDAAWMAVLHSVASDFACA